jgi:hypothetical protein
MTKIDFSNQFSICSKGLNWMAPKLLRNWFRFAAVSFLKGLMNAAFPTKDRKVCAIYHRVHLK